MIKPKRFQDGDEVFTSNKYSKEIEGILKRNNWTWSAFLGCYINESNCVGYLNVNADREKVSSNRWKEIVECGYVYHLINYPQRRITEDGDISLCKTVTHTCTIIEITKLLCGKFNRNVMRFFDLIVSPNTKEVVVKVPYKATSQYFIVGYFNSTECLEGKEFQLPNQFIYSLDYNEEVYLSGSRGYTEEEYRNEWAIRKLRE